MEQTLFRDLIPVWSTEARDLSVEIGEQPRLQQRVVGDVDARRQVCRVEGNLLGLGEVVRDIAVEGHRSDDLHRG